MSLSLSNSSNSSYQFELNSPLFMPSPQSKEELIERLRDITGRSLCELATIAKVPLPQNNTVSKGFAGQLIELFLGCNAHNLPLPDFIELGIELKTLPVGADLKPKESTFICSADISPNRYIPFEKSSLYHKLKSILFVLLLTQKGQPLEQRRVVAYFFYQPNEQELEVFKKDYEELSELLSSANAHNIDSSYGTYIQMRPKGNANDLALIHNEAGELSVTCQRAYYLRPEFTRKLCQQFSERFVLNRTEQMQSQDLNQLTRLNTKNKNQSHSQYQGLHQGQYQDQGQGQGLHQDQYQDQHQGTYESTHQGTNAALNADPDDEDLNLNIRLPKFKLEPMLKKIQGKPTSIDDIVVDEDSIL